MGYNTPKQTVSQFQLKGRYARQYLSFAGKSSKDFLLYLSGPGVYDSPAADVESTSVPGRNGDIITENARTGRRRYQNVDIKYKAFFFNGLPAKTAAVKAWLLSPIGYQKLQDTYDPDFFRMAVCKDALVFDVTAQKAAEMGLTFNCKPQRWSVDGQRSIRLESRATLKNPFAFPAQPIFKVYGDSGGELYVGEEKITIYSIKDYVLLNCETHNAYNASGFCNETILSDDFPELPEGKTQITWTGGITAVEVTPRWWTLQEEVQPVIPCLYDSREMKFDHNGIGKLADAQSCTVTEKRNGSYELKLICPADGIHAEMLEEGNIILAKSSDTMQPQPFRIYKITTPIDGKLEVQARHISYQLNFITVSPFSVTGCVGAMRGLKSHAASDCPFNVWADVESSATFTLGVPSSFRNCLGGMAGSVLDVFGGEFEWDRYTVKFHKARGADHNVHIIYGKNLTDFKMEKSIENTITGVHPYWVDNETQAVMELPEKVVLQSKRSIPYQKITVLDCTSNFQEKPSEAALREYAQNYIDTTDLTEPEIDIKIDFLQLWNTPGYEDIVEAERVSLCDTVHVFISKLGIEVSSKVTETEYDTLLERYNSITLSNSTVSSRNSSLTGSLNSIRNTATIAYDTAVRAETAVGEQVGGITASIIYDGALFAALFGLHYKNETDSKGNTTRYAFNAATLKQSTVAWKNSSAGLFVSTDGGKTWGYGWESDDTAVETAILLEQNLKELDDRYKKATELSEELLKELDDRYKTATALSSELQEQLDQRYETAKKLSKELSEELDRRYGNVTTLSEALQKELDERYSVAKKLSEDVEKELDKKYQPSIPVSETAPEEPGNDALWVDKKNLRLKLWDGENWRIVGYEPEDPKDPEKPVEPEGPDNTGQGGGESDGSKEETNSGNADTGDGSDNRETSPDLSGD